MSVADIIQAKGHTERFLLWPQLWWAYDSARDLTWRHYRLSAVERQNIPNAPGVYTLLIQPNVADHPACSYLMYIGKAESLRRRFGRYLTSERRESGRPKVWWGLNVYSDYIWFCYAPVPSDALDEIEGGLLAAHVPPWNTRLPAEMKKKVGAFRDV